MARISLLVLLAALAAVPLARADGDPASDILISQQTFVPPDDGIPKASAAQLDAAVRDAKAHGYRIRVAVIGSRYDMGSVTVLYEQPKQYARFLGIELKPFYKGKLLVVMPNGLAVSQHGRLLARETEAVSRVRAPGTGGRALAAAGTAAVVKLAGIKAPAAGSNSTAWILIAVGVALGVVALAGILWRRKLPGLDSNQQPFG